jgi:hypothetical protein
VKKCQGRGMPWDMSNERATHCKPSESSAERVRAEYTRARETRRLLSKLSLSAEQAEVIEGFSRSLIDEITRGPIAKTVALTRRPSEPVANVETPHDKLGEKQDGIEEKAKRDWSFDKPD